MTVLSPCVLAFSKHYKSLNNIKVFNRDYCTFVAYSDSCVLTCGVSGYTNNCKYASCSSYGYVIPTGKSTGSFVKRESTNSGYVNGIASTTAHCLNVINNPYVDKTIFYGEIFCGGTNQSRKLERIWVTKYRNPSIALYDGITKFDD